MNSPEIEFVKRTKVILESSLPHKQGFSLLVNCSFGLVVFPYAIVLSDLGITGTTRGWWNKSPFWKRNLREIDNLPPIIKNYLTQNAFPKTIGELFYKLRNTLCHNRFEPINENRKLVGIGLIFKKGFTVEFKKKELKEVLVFVANVYLEHLSV